MIRLFLSDPRSQKVFEDSWKIISEKNHLSQNFDELVVKYSMIEDLVRITDSDPETAAIVIDGLGNDVTSILTKIKMAIKESGAQNLNWPIIVICNLDVKQIALTMIDFPNIVAMIAERNPFSALELASALFSSIAGVEAITPQKVPPRINQDAQILHIYDSSSIPEVVKEVVDAVAKLNSFQQMPFIAGTVATELLTNAFFNAPVSYPGGEPIYRNISRMQKFSLSPGKSIELQYGHLDGQFILQVKDPFGSLNPGDFFANLFRAAEGGNDQIKMHTKGAGVGLYTVLSNTKTLQVDMIPWVSTEITCIMNICKRQRDFDEIGYTIHYRKNIDGGTNE